MADESNRPVGYGNPPVQHRFKKGQSGNPRGRPRRRTARVADTEYGLKAAQELFHREMYRPVVARDGDKSVEMPAIQALIRSTMMAAIKGDRWARKLLMATIERFENEEFTAQLQYFGQVVAYKDGWRDAVEQYRERKLPLPDPFPHPDDFHLDFDRALVTYTGPTDEQKAAIDRAIGHKTALQEEISFFSGEYRRAKTAADKARCLREWHRDQVEFDMLNATLPPRYKTRLKDRSYHDGASRPDQPLADLREQFERMMDEYRVRAGMPPRQTKPEDRT